MNGVQTRLKCKPNVKRCKRFVFAAHSPLLHPNTLKTKAIIHFQTDHILTRFVFPPLKSEYHQRLFCRQFEDGSRKAYPIVTSSPESAAEIPGKLEGDYDLIFFDLPGTVNSRGVFESVMNMDFIFTPIVKDRMVMQSSLSFVSTVQDFIGQHPEAPLKDIRLFWNRMDSRTSKELYVMYNAIVLRMGLKVFETVLPDLERFNKEMTPSSRQHFRCTLLPPSESLLKDSRLEAFAQEMERIIFPG